jgi:archaellum component FlaF (FlaF/FlaG flagellin family)
VPHPRARTSASVTISSAFKELGAVSMALQQAFRATSNWTRSHFRRAATAGNSRLEIVRSKVNAAAHVLDSYKTCASVWRCSLSIPCKGSM